MGILAWIALGLIAGLLARYLMPGAGPGGIIVTILLGIAGALVGGFLGQLIGFGGVDAFDLRSVVQEPTLVGGFLKVTRSPSHLPSCGKRGDLLFSGQFRGTGRQSSPPFASNRSAV
jgi:uncharacterized membrane protein YeaQ/YmgE (transglycosylase-associated protein family)